MLLELIARLETITDLPAYAATAAHHGCDGFLRGKFPQRHRLGTRIRYLLETSPLYSLWQTSEGLVCGLKSYEKQSPRMDLDSFWAKEVAVPSRPDEAKVTAAIFAHLQAPLRLSDLIDAVAVLLNIRDQTTSISGHDVAAQEMDIAGRIDRRQTLRQLWGEIALLPQQQRAALLLNLRDDEGGCALTSLPATGVASLRQIAAIVEIPAEKLAELWMRLPLSDLEIAAMLGVSRQQVINLRKSARERLGRRMTGNIPEKPSST